MSQESEEGTLFILQQLQCGSRVEATGQKVHHGVVPSVRQRVGLVSCVFEGVFHSPQCEVNNDFLKRSGRLEHITSGSLFHRFLMYYLSNLCKIAALTKFFTKSITFIK